MDEGRQKLLRYGHLLALLHMLVKARMLTEEEAQGIKGIIKKKYHILSEYAS